MLINMSSDRGSWVPAVPVSAVLCSWLFAAFVLPQMSAAPRADVKGLLALARTAQLERWPSTAALARVQKVDGDPRLDGLVELLATVLRRPAPNEPLPEVLFTGGRKVAATRPDVTFEGWASIDLHDGGCDVIVYFRPLADVSGEAVWIHAYPENGQEYTDLSRSLPAVLWTRGDVGWEVFRSEARERFTIYAGVSRNGQLGPATLLGSVDRCGRALP